MDTVNNRQEQSMDRIAEIYDQILDNADNIEICGLFYEVSFAFKIIDNVAYTQGLNNFMDDGYDEIKGKYYRKQY